MPPNHKGDQEARISQAIEAIHSNNSPSIRAAARAYDVPYSTLVKRLHGQPTYQQSRMANRKLLPTEEEALFQWVISMGERDFHVGSLLYAKWLIFFFQRTLIPPPTRHPLWVKLGPQICQSP